MPELSVEAGGQVVVTIRLESATIREAIVSCLGGRGVSIELGGVNVGVRFVGRPDVLLAMLADAEREMSLALRQVGRIAAD